MILNRHHHLPEVETHRSVPLPFRLDQPFGRYSRKKAKNEDCANRHVPSANDRFLIGTIIFPRSKHIDQCLSLLRSDQPFGHYSRKKLKIRIVPIAIGMCATDRLSTGTVIFPMLKHIDYCLSHSDRTSRSDGIPEKAKNKVCQSSCAKCHQSILNGHRHLPEVENIDQCLSLLRSDQPFGHYSRKG